MSNLLSLLLTFLQSYGYLALWITVYIAAVGIPIPITLLLLAAGAFAALGDFNVLLLFIISFSALVCGDNTGYWIGRIWGSRALNWIERSKRWNLLIPPQKIAQSRQYFRHRGGWGVRSRARLAYRLRGSYRSFQTTLGAARSSLLERDPGSRKPHE